MLKEKTRGNSHPLIFQHGVLYGEEPDLSPTYEVFFVGCDFRCRFCYVQDRIYAGRGKYTPQEVAQAISEAKGIASIELVGGEASLHISAWPEVLKGNRQKVPVVLNSHFCFPPHLRDPMETWIDVWIANFHFGNDLCAYRLAGVKNYLSRFLPNLFWALQRGKNLIVRHLLKPGHLSCCFEGILKYLLPWRSRVRFHLMLNFYDLFGRSGLPSELTREEKEKAVARVEEAGFSRWLMSPRRSFPAPREDTVSAFPLEVRISPTGGVVIPYLDASLLKVLRAVANVDIG
jgi:putative pyruvate formate lyase activating enzyme